MKLTKFRTIIAGGILLSAVVMATPQTLASTQNAANGYLYVSSPTGPQGVQQWVERLHGNAKVVANDLANDTNNGTTAGSIANYDAFPSVVSASNAKFGPGASPTITFAPSNATTNWQSGNYVKIMPNGSNTSDTWSSSGGDYGKITYSVTASFRPQVLNLSIGQKGIVKQGQPLNIVAKVNVPLWAGLAKFHYVAVKVANNVTGQTEWVVSGNGAYTINGINMRPVVGGHGILMDQLKPNSDFSTSSLKLGTYTATTWVADGVQRLDKPVTATFSVK